MRKQIAFTTSALLGLSLLAGCGGKIKPKGPVITPYERNRDFSMTKYSTAKYSTGIPPFTDAPVLPFMAFGMPFDIDVAIGLKDDDWDMLEFARVQTPEGPQWVVLESRAETLDQVLVSNHPDIETWLPELPIERQRSNLVVTDRTTSDGLDIEVQYDNSNNEPVSAVLQGDPPTKYAKKRNGNTMGHGANMMLALLDISSAESLFKGEVRINDKKVPNRSVGGIVPMRFSLTQTQGGIASGTYQQVPTRNVPFEQGAELMAAKKWEPPPPPPPKPVVPEPMNMPTEDDGFALLPIEEWELLGDEDRELAMSAQTANAESCLLGATAIDPEYKGLAVVDFYVKQGKAWQVTVHAESTANELVMNCVAEMIAGYEFTDAEDEKNAKKLEALEGSIRIEVGTFPEGHEPMNDLEKAFIEAKAAMTEEGDEGEEGEEEPGDGEEDLPDGESLEDLLGDDPEAETMPETGAAPIAHFESIHTMASGDKVVQGWYTHRVGDRVLVVQDSGVRQLTYEYLIHGEDSVLELRSIQVDTWGSAVPAFTVTFNPALPDMRRQFGGRATSQFVMDVNGQQNYASGTVEATFGDSGGKLVIQPDAPKWAENRPLISTINFKDRMPFITTRRAE